MSEPPKHIIEHAIVEARRSPCAKSRRGSVVFEDGNIGTIRGLGHNRSPNRDCDGSPACRASCAKRCLHAEQTAISAALIRYANIAGCNILHVKIGAAGELVAGGKPSCWQCSRLVLEHGLSFWLYEANHAWYSRDCACGYVHQYGDDSPDGDRDLEHCPACGGDLSPTSQVVYSTDGTWRQYSPRGFHVETAINCGIHP